MAIIRWAPRAEWTDPFANLADIREEMNRMFEESFRRFGRGRESVFLPPLDLEEDKDALVVRVELPGLRREDVQVSLQGDVLSIRGEKKQEHKKAESAYHCRECIQGAFVRTIELPSAVDPKQIEAKFQDGILTVRLPKTEGAKPKQIDIQVGG